jgi:hypothetical protein
MISWPSCFGRGSTSWQEHMVGKSTPLATREQREKRNKLDTTILFERRPQSPRVPLLRPHLKGSMSSQ